MIVSYFLFLVSKFYVSMANAVSMGFARLTSLRASPFC
jgi:hypothetical protein